MAASHLLRSGAGLVVSALLLTGCASVGPTLDRLWPFGRDGGASGEERGARPADRIPVLGTDLAPTADAALAATAVTVPAAQALASWPHAGGTSGNAPQNVAGTAALDVAFRRQVGAAPGRHGAMIAPPIVAEGRVYVLDAGLTVHAVSADGGRPVWRETLSRAERERGGWFRLPGSGGQALGGGLAYDAGRVFAATGFGELVAMEAATGRELWRVKVDAPLHAAPLAAGGRVFITSVASELFAIDQVTGQIQWTTSALVEPARMLTAPSPALVGDTLVAPFASGEVTASLVANGRRLWSEALTRQGAATSLSTISDIAGRPAVFDGLVYAASQAGVVAAIDLRTGTRIWEQPVSSIQTPWVSGDFVYVVSTDGQVFCMERRTGGIKWVRQLTRDVRQQFRTRRVAWTGPVMVDGRLVVGSSQGEVLALSPQDGSTLATRDVGSALFIPPAVAGGLVYFYSNEARLVALR
jgi:outer membrane protein assembly factor BamB